MKKLVKKRVKSVNGSKETVEDEKINANLIGVPKQHVHVDKTFQTNSGVDYDLFKIRINTSIKDREEETCHRDTPAVLSNKLRKKKRKSKTAIHKESTTSESEIERYKERLGDADLNICMVKDESKNLRIVGKTDTPLQKKVEFADFDAVYGTTPEVTTVSTLESDEIIPNKNPQTGVHEVQNEYHTSFCEKSIQKPDGKQEVSPDLEFREEEPNEQNQGKNPENSQKWPKSAQESPRCQNSIISSQNTRHPNHSTLNNEKVTSSTSLAVPQLQEPIRGEQGSLISGNSNTSPQENKQKSIEPNTKSPTLPNLLTRNKNDEDSFIFEKITEINTILKQPLMNNMKEELIVVNKKKQLSSDNADEVETSQLSKGIKHLIKYGSKISKKLSKENLQETQKESTKKPKRALVSTIPKPYSKRKHTYSPHEVENNTTRITKESILVPSDLNIPEPNEIKRTTILSLSDLKPYMRSASKTSISTIKTERGEFQNDENSGVQTERINHTLQDTTLVQSDTSESKTLSKHNQIPSVKDMVTSLYLMYVAQKNDQNGGSHNNHKILSNNRSNETSVEILTSTYPDQSLKENHTLFPVLTQYSDNIKETNDRVSLVKESTKDEASFSELPHTKLNKIPESSIIQAFPSHIDDNETFLQTRTERDKITDRPTHEQYHEAKLYENNVPSTSISEPYIIKAKCSSGLSKVSEKKRRRSKKETNFNGDIVTIENVKLKRKRKILGNEGSFVEDNSKEELIYLGKLPQTNYNVFFSHESTLDNDKYENVRDSKSPRTVLSKRLISEGPKGILIFVNKKTEINRNPFDGNHVYRYSDDSLHVGPQKVKPKLSSDGKKRAVVEKTPSGRIIQRYPCGCVRIIKRDSKGKELTMEETTSANCRSGSECNVRHPQLQRHKRTISLDDSGTERRNEPTEKSRKSSKDKRSVKKPNESERKSEKDRKSERDKKSERDRKSGKDRELEKERKSDKSKKSERDKKYRKGDKSSVMSNSEKRGKSGKYPGSEFSVDSDWSDCSENSMDSGSTIGKSSAHKSKSGKSQGKSVGGNLGRREDNERGRTTKSTKSGKADRGTSGSKRGYGDKNETIKSEEGSGRSRKSKKTNRGEDKEMSVRDTSWKNWSLRSDKDGRFTLSKTTDPKGYLPELEIIADGIVSKDPIKPRPPAPTMNGANLTGILNINSNKLNGVCNFYLDGKLKKYLLKNMDKIKECLEEELREESRSRRFPNE